MSICEPQALPLRPRRDSKLFSLTIEELSEFPAAYRMAPKGGVLGLTALESRGLAKWLGITNRNGGARNSRKDAAAKKQKVALRDIVAIAIGSTNHSNTVAIAYDPARREELRKQLFAYIAMKRQHVAAIEKLRSTRKRGTGNIEAQEAEVLRLGGIVAGIDAPSVVAELHAGSPEEIAKAQMHELYARLRGRFLELSRSLLEEQLACLSRRLILGDCRTEIDAGGTRSDQEIDLDWRRRIGNCRAPGRIGDVHSTDCRRDLQSAAGIGSAGSLPDVQGGVEKRKRMSAQQIAIIKQLRAEGSLKPQEIAEVAGCTVAAVYRHTKQEKHKYTDDDIRDAYKCGWTTKQIKKEMRVPSDRVIEAIEGIARGRRDHNSRYLSAGDVFKIKALYRRGWTNQMISWQVHCHHDTIRKHTAGEVRFQPVIKLDHGGVNMHKKLSVKTTRAIRDECIAGVPTLDIMETYEVSCAMVRYCRPFDVRYDIVERAERTAAIRSMYKRGYTYNEIAAEWSILVQDVRAWCGAASFECIIEDLWPGIYPEPDAPEPDAAVEAPPGSVLKMIAMRERLDKEQALHHHADASPADQLGFDLVSIHLRVAV